MLNFFNIGRYGSSKSFFQSVKKEDTNPNDILEEDHLTNVQKRMVLEAMLTEARDEENSAGNTSQFTFTSNASLIEKILKAKAKLLNQMD